MKDDAEGSRPGQSDDEAPTNNVVVDFDEATGNNGLIRNLNELNAKWPEARRRSEDYMREYADQLWEHFLNAGKFFVDGAENLSVFYGHKIYRLGDNMPWKALLHREAGLNSTTLLSKFVNAELQANCLNHGARISSFSWIHLINTGEGPLLYLNLKDPDNRICRLSPGCVDLVDNGTNDESVLLAESAQMASFSFNAEVDIESGMTAMKSLMFDAMACEPAQRYLTLAWALSAYLIPVSEGKALLKMEGGSGSGKTAAAKLISRLLYGNNRVGRSTTASDYSCGSVEPMVIKDNLETDDLRKNALNFLLLAATGAQNLKRAAGTDSGVTAEQVTSLVAVTAIEPFAKPELINRSYVVNFEKRWQRKGFIESANLQEIESYRDDILSAWLKVMASDVMGQLHSRDKIIKYISQHHPDFTKPRTTEYLSLLVLIARALLRWMPLPDELDAGDRNPALVLLDAWIAIQDETARDTEHGTSQVLHFLEGVCRAVQTEFKTRTDPTDQRFFIPLVGTKVKRECRHDVDGMPVDDVLRFSFETTTRGLLEAMQRYAREHGVRCPFSNAKQLATRLHNERDVITDAGFDVERTRKVRGTRFRLIAWTADQAL